MTIADTSVSTDTEGQTLLWIDRHAFGTDDTTNAAVTQRH
jgi:hypothetical protein